MCKTVLICDDNEISLRIVARFFKSIGWCSIKCRMADLVYPILLDNYKDVELLLTDYSLSERHTALTIIKGVRQWERESQAEKPLPIVVFSAHSDVKASVISAGADLFVPKPLTLQHVTRIVANYVT
ncbi:hypothetical protein DFS34DRAFT_626771 [Phlyctochytrium arcticum]|nr:hypothetical protein DFS34DRAFT_626771 [Phlyctochytrium arcticum]